jgi:hypothetical protein
MNRRLCFQVAQCFSCGSPPGFAFLSRCTPSRNHQFHSSATPRRKFRMEHARKHPP